MRTNLREIAARATKDDPGRPLWEALGDLSEMEMGPSYLLVATYIAPDRIGSILLADRRLDEDRFQGKIGLIVKAGSLAFTNSGRTDFGGFAPQVGDWVMYRPSDGLECFVRDRRKINEGTSCRLLSDALIMAKVPAPDLIY